MFIYICLYMYIYRVNPEMTTDHMVIQQPAEIRGPIHGHYRILPIPVSYGVWHAKCGLRVGDGRILRNRCAIGLTQLYTCIYTHIHMYIPAVNPNPRVIPEL